VPEAVKAQIPTVKLLLCVAPGKQASAERPFAVCPGPLAHGKKKNEVDGHLMGMAALPLP